jgi:hypothetical protein
VELKALRDDPSLLMDFGPRFDRLRDVAKFKSTLATSGKLAGKGSAPKVSLATGPQASTLTVGIEGQTTSATVTASGSKKRRCSPQSLPALPSSGVIDQQVLMPSCASVWQIDVSI